MYPSQQLRGRFTEDGLTTASGPQIVVMCFDRLDRDLDGAIASLEGHDLARSHELLCHAQDIVHELLFMIDLECWEHAPSLAAIYRYVIELLTRSNIAKRPAEALEARKLLAELGDAFRVAASGRAFPTEYSTPSTQFSVRA